jgi:hypothetical protein
MSDCSRLSDRMPAVALGRSTWTAEEATHLAECVSCRQEWELVRVSSRLGKGIGADLDGTATSREVLQRLERHKQSVRLKKSWGFAALSGAAAAAAIIWVSRTETVRTPSPPPAAVASLRIQLPELDNLLPAELNAVLQTIDEPYVGGSDDGTMNDSDEELESGLETWEG